MATFEVAVEFMLTHEGDYSNDSEDPGGETRWGISKRSYPDVDIKNLTREEAIEIYHRDYWLPAYAEIWDQSIASKLFDLAVNMGPSKAHTLIQRALRACCRKVVEDGKFGPATLASVNMADPMALLSALRSEAAGFYRMLNKPRFERGWLNRAYE